MYFIKCTSNVSLSYILIICVITIILIVMRFIKFRHKILNKIFSKNLFNYYALIFGIIIGIIYSSINSFKNIENSLNIWVYEIVSFTYSLGSYLIIITLILYLFMIPNYIYKLLNHQNETYNLKKIIFIFMTIMVVMGISNIQWGINYNNYSTPVNVFSLNNNIYFKDYFYYGAKWIYTYILNSSWIFFAFISYILLNYLIIYIFNDKIRQQSINNIIKPYIFTNNFSFLILFYFISTYIISNPLSFIIHNAYMLISLLLIYLLLILLCVIIIFFTNNKIQKYKYISIKFKQIFCNKKYCEINQIDCLKTNIFENKILNVCIVGLFFSSYLLFNNYYMDNQYIFPTNNIYFWIAIIISTFIFILLANNYSDLNEAKNFMSIASPYVCTGLQTSIFSWTNNIINKTNLFLNTIYEII